MSIDAGLIGESIFVRRIGNLRVERAFPLRSDITHLMFPLHFRHQFLNSSVPS